MITAALELIEFWHWWIFALALLVLEMLLPGTFFLWMAVAGAIVGLLLLVLPDTSWQAQLLVFGSLSVVAIIGWRIWQHRHPTTTDESTLNRRGAKYVGRLLTLSDPIENGIGKIRIDDTLWKIATTDSSDLDAGAQVRVVGTEGTVLMVEKV